MKKAIALIIAVLMLALCFAACKPAVVAPPPAEGGKEVTTTAPEGTDTPEGTLAQPQTIEVFRLQLASEPDHLDPALNSSVDGACLAANSFGGLYTYNPQGQLIPGFATGYEMSEDGLTYTFTLREGLKWSDGSDLTANDFVWSWNRAANPATAADYAYMFDVIKGYPQDDDEEFVALAVSAPDALTLVVELYNPCAYFLDLAAFPTYYPVKQSEVEGAAGYKDADGNILDAGAWAQEAGFVSCGAFVLESWVHNESMVYVKNPYWYDADKVCIEKLEFMLSADDVAIFAAYNAGDLDFIDTVPNDEIAKLQADNSPEFYVISELGTYYVCFNVGSKLFNGMTPDDAATMRKALCRLVNREFVIETVAQTGQLPATSFLPYDMLDGSGKLFKDAANHSYPVGNGYFPIEPDVAEAITMLESVGFKFADGKLDPSTPIAFEYLTNESTGHIAIAECIQQDFAAIGITMTIKAIDWQTFLNERKAGNYDVARNGWIADFSDPINMLEMWGSGSGNNDCQFGKTSSAAAPDWAQYDANLAKIKSMTDFAARAKLMHETEDILMGTGAIMPIYYYNDLYMLKPGFNGLFANAYATKFFMYITPAA